MPTVLGKAIDSAFPPRPTAQQIGARGYAASGRYYGGSPAKRLTRAEADELVASRVIPFTVMEGGATMAFAPSSAAAVAGEALREAAGAGQPAGTCIYFACDSDPTGHEAVVTDFFTRVAAIVRPAGFLVGFYGQGQLGSALKAAGVVDRLWATVAWSRGFVPANADLLQLVAKDPLLGADHDVNLIFSDDFGGWSRLGVTPPVFNPHPNPDPPNLPEDPLYARVDDPSTGGHWLSDAVGHVQSWCLHRFPNGTHPDGSTCGTAPGWLGNLTDHPEWNPGTLVGFAPTVRGGQVVGYTFECDHGGGRLSPYAFPL